MPPSGTNKDPAARTSAGKPGLGGESGYDLEKNVAGREGLGVWALCALVWGAGMLPRLFFTILSSIQAGEGKAGIRC